MGRTDPRGRSHQNWSPDEKNLGFKVGFVLCNHIKMCFDHVFMEKKIVKPWKSWLRSINVNKIWNKSLTIRKSYEIASIMFDEEG